MHEISDTPNNKKFPKFRNDCFNVSRLLFSNSGFIFHSQRSKQSLKPQRACPWRKIYGSMFFSPLSFFFTKTIQSVTKCLHREPRTCIYFVALLFRGSYFVDHWFTYGSAPPPRCCSPETMLRKCQSRWLVIVFWLYLCKRRRGCYIRVLHLRVCVCARAAILTRTHVNWTWASTSSPPRSPSPRFGGGLGRVEGGSVFVCQVPRPSRLCALPDSASP